MRHQWIYPVLTCLMVIIVQTSHYAWGSLVLLGYWIIRLCYLQNRTLVMISIGLSCIVAVRVHATMHQQQRLEDRAVMIENTEITRHVYPKPTSVVIDGDALRFKAIDTETKEEIRVSYTLQSLEEKHFYQAYAFEQPLSISGIAVLPREQRNFNQFNYRAYLKRHHTFYKLNAATIQQADKEETLPWRLVIDRWRARLFRLIERIMHGKSTTYTQTLLFAKPYGLSDDSMQFYRDTGMIHLISISGLHIHVCIALITYLMIRCGVTKKMTAFILLGCLPIYGMMAGFGTSVFRAVIQSMIYFIGILSGRSQECLDRWSITMLLALLWSPMQIYSIGFQLSYTLSGCLMLWQSNNTLHRFPTCLKPAILSVMMGIVSLPIITYHYFEFPVVSIALNILFVPLFSMIIFPAIIVTFGLSLMIPHSLMIDIMNHVLHMMEKGLSTIGDLPYTRLITGRLSFVAMSVLVLSIGVGLFYLEQQKGTLYRWVGVILCGITALLSTRYTPLGEVVMIDVGQGDSMVIKRPFQDGGIMIDTGGHPQWSAKEQWRQRDKSYALGEQVLIPVLKSMGITHLERVYVSHPDIDHMGALATLVRQFSVEEIAGTEETFQDPTYQSVMQQITHPIHRVIEAPSVMTHGALSLAVLQPQSGDSFDSTNEASLVLYGTIGQYDWLWTGDMEEAAERLMIERYPTLPIDVLKVAHHGSASSSTPEFMRQYQPTIGLISAGEDNQFGHPHPEVIERLEGEEMEIYRTDVQGAIRYRYLPVSTSTIFWSDIETVRSSSDAY